MIKGGRSTGKADSVVWAWLFEIGRSVSLQQELSTSTMLWTMDNIVLEGDSQQLVRPIQQRADEHQTLSGCDSCGYPTPFRVFLEHVDVFCETDCQQGWSYCGPEGSERSRAFYVHGSLVLLCGYYLS
ncbi:hypothetical protein RHMOL_Rhmol12G0127300 [Rhododendron molle]|uniref:Uncharacterized protein n=1 Tax=Rhododendron molle TaxID=49168 RepID=A0ACC0LHA3_RHOML|nr:hypothetical protein RHMOL_Rhmol12G0127300 [Rhododendron molle]